MMTTNSENTGCLRREYLGKDESGAPLPACSGTNRGDFTFDGHRLSSLYRDISLRARGLRKSLIKLFSASSLQKYSTPAHIMCAHSEGTRI